MFLKCDYRVPLSFKKVKFNFYLSACNTILWYYQFVVQRGFLLNALVAMIKSN